MTSFFLIKIWILEYQLIQFSEKRLIYANQDAFILKKIKLSWFRHCLNLGCPPFQVVYAEEISGLWLVSAAETCRNIEFIYGFRTAETISKSRVSAASVAESTNGGQSRFTQCVNPCKRQVSKWKPCINHNFSSVFAQFQ